jgi:hypothetical protein
LGVNYEEAGRLADAVRIFDEWLPRAQAKLLPGQEPLPFARRAGAVIYERAGLFDRADVLWREAVPDVRRTLAATAPPGRTGALATLGWTLPKAREPAETEMVLRECLDIREKKEPDSWTTFNARSLLGEALLGQKKYDDAEPLLVEGYEGLKQREAKIPPAGKPNLTSALERLVHLYDAWGKPEQAEQWRKELEAHKTKAGMPLDKEKKKKSP